MSTLTGTGVVVRIDNGVPLRGTLTIETDRIDVSTFTPPRLPDPSWTFVDSAGHFHAFDVVSAGANQFFGFAHFTSSHRWEPGDLGEAPWAEFICSPLARRKIRPVDALPPDGPPALTPPG